MPVPPAEACSPVPAPGAPPPGTLLPEHYSGCYGCGRDVPGGLHLRVTTGEGLQVTGACTLTELHQGAPGLAHGGILAAAFDEVTGYLAPLLRRPAVTGRLEVDYRLPVPLGELRLAARCTAAAGRKVWATAEAILPDGRVAAEASALFVTVAAEHFERHRPASVAAPLVPTGFGP